MAQQLRPGESVPESGVYRVSHEPTHFGALYQLNFIRGRRFPGCPRCRVISFELLKSHEVEWRHRFGPPRWKPRPSSPVEHRSEWHVGGRKGRVEETEDRSISILDCCSLGTQLGRDFRTNRLPFLGLERPVCSRCGPKAGRSPPLSGQVKTPVSRM